MAKIQAGTVFETNHTVADPNTRDYSYAGSVGSAGDVAVALNGAPVSPSLYTVAINPSNTGGTVHLLTAAEVSGAAVYAVGDEIRVYRDTVINQRVSFGQAGFARSASAEGLASHLIRILEELAGQGRDITIKVGGEVLGTAGTIHTMDFLGTAFEILRSGDEVTVRFTGPEMPDPGEMGLTDAQARELSQSVAVGSIEQPPRGDGTITFVSHDGTEAIINFNDIVEEAVKDFAWGGHPADTTRRLIAAAMAGPTAEDQKLSYNDLKDHPAVASGFFRMTPAAAAVDITTSATAGTWSPWTDLVTTAALTDEQAGDLILAGHVHIETTADPTNGGQRVITECRIQRTRGAADTVIADDTEYGPRNVGGSIPAGFRDASQIADKNLIEFDQAELGDVYKLQVRVIAQVASIATTFTVAGNRLSIAQLGVQGRKGDKGDPGDPGTGGSLVPVGATLPDASTSDVGDFFNLNGVWYELVAGSEDPHIIRGTAAALDNGYIGTAEFAWQPGSPNGVRMFLSKAVLGSSPAAAPGLIVDRSDRYHGEIVMQRDSASDTTEDYAYIRNPSSAAIAEGKVGETFTVQVYNDEDRDTELRVHALADNRWEQDARGMVEERKAWYDRAKQLLVEGGHTGITFDDTTLKITISERGIGTGTTLPVDPKVGDQFILLSDTTVQHDPVRTAYQAQSTLRQMALNGGTGAPEALRGYSLTYGGPNAATRQGRVFLDYNGARTKTAVRVWLYGEGATPRSYLVEADSRAGIPNEYVVTGLSYADFLGMFHSNVENSDGTKLNPDEVQPQGHLIYKGNSVWEFAPGVAAAWATQGRPEPREVLAVTVGNLPSNASLIVSDSGATTPAHSDIVAFTPLIDLSEDVNLHGVLNFSIPLHFTARDSTTIGFDSHTTSPLQSILFRGWCLASRLREALDFLQPQGSQFNGVMLGEVPVLNGAGDLGAVEIWAGHGAADHVGLFLGQKAGTGSLGFTVATNGGRVVLEHNDGPASVTQSFVVRGPEWARTRALPTVIGTDGNDVFPNDATVKWTKDDNAPAAISTGTGRYLTIPSDTPDEQTDGIWVVAYVGEVEQGALKMPWGPGALRNEVVRQAQSSGIIVANKRTSGQSDAVTLEIKYNVWEPTGAPTIGVYWDHVEPSNPVQALAADTHIRVFAAGIFAA